MSDAEKLRALLVEVQRIVNECGGCIDCGIGSQEVWPRIDAALAEPVVDYQRERDEARAEVERLRKRVEEEGSLELALLEETGRALKKREWESVKDAAERTMSERDDARDDIAAAYQRGAEAMREAAALQVMFSNPRVPLAFVAIDIRALPIREDKP